MSPPAIRSFDLCPVSSCSHLHLSGLRSIHLFSLSNLSALFQAIPALFHGPVSPPRRNRASPHPCRLCPHEILAWAALAVRTAAAFVSLRSGQLHSRTGSVSCCLAACSTLESWLSAYGEYLSVAFLSPFILFPQFQATLAEASPHRR
jgi:hypothetical protein